MIIFRRRFHQLEKLVSVPNLLYLTTGAWGMDFISSSPLFSTTKFSYKSFLFQNFHNHSFFLHFYIMNNTCILCPHFFDWYSIREKVCNYIFIFRAISLTLVGKPQCFFYTFYLVYIWHCRIKLFLRHLPNCPCSYFSPYVDLFQEISPRIGKQLRF